MDTCLDSLWELIRNPIGKIVNDSGESVIDKAKLLSEKCILAAECKNNIDEFFKNLIKKDYLSESHSVEMPDHLIIFRDLLENFSEISVNGLSIGAKKAKESVNQCKLCSVCRGCANEFYDEISKRKIVEKSLPFDLENYFSNRPQMFYYNSNLKDESEKVDLTDKLLCLKGFSSSTPTVHSIAFNSDCVGGGLYINYKGLGIAIDPGIGFVDSMHKNGIYINNIDVVIITHDHLDHNSDAEMISSLLYDYNGYFKRKNAIVKDVFQFQGEQEHSITWIVDDDTKKKLKGKVKNITRLNDFVGSKKQIITHNKDIKLSAIHTKHVKDNNNTYGIKIYLSYDKEFIVGYTSDTMYFDDLSKFFNGLNIIIFNVSDIYKNDVKGIKDKHSHLGYNRSLKLLQNISSDLAIASEFCCTNGDFRMGFVNTLNSELKEVNLLPGEIGLKVDIPNLLVECSICKSKSSLKDVTIIAPKKDFEKIQYICRHCLNVVI